MLQLSGAHCPSRVAGETTVGCVTSVAGCVDRTSSAFSRAKGIFRLLLSALTFSLAACAVQPIQLSDRADTTYQVPARRLNIDDFSTESKIAISDTVYVSGWTPAHTGFSPPLHEAFVARLRNSLTPTGESGRLDITVLRVGFFVEKSVADNIAFIGLLVVGRERGFKCDADVNIRTDSDSRRLVLSHEIRRPYFDNREQIGRFVESCHSDITRQLAEVTEQLIQTPRDAAPQDRQSKPGSQSAPGPL